MPIRFRDNVDYSLDSPSILSLPNENQQLTPVMNKRIVSSETNKSSVLDRLNELFPPGSLKSSVFNLCSATLGAGALALPYAFSQCGLIVGLILIIF